MTSSELSTIHDIISSERICMLVTMNGEGRLHAHPMTTQAAEYDGTSWFVAKSTSETVRDIQSRPSVNVSYSGKSSWLSIAGTASVVDDPAKKAELWNTFTEAWFPGGKDDPAVVVVRVSGESAEYWDGPGRAATVISLVKARLTGGTPDSGESGAVDLTKPAGG
jgi:general stress protein 26